MFAFHSTILLALLFGAASARKVCYNEYGCFVDTYPFSGSFQRPIAVLPDSPEKIATKFTLYNKKNQISGERITVDFLGSFFDSVLPTKLIVHGFLHHHGKSWIAYMRRAILNASDVNVIVVDWSRGMKLYFL